ncbi:MAG TPA: hypothetical protein VLC53_18005, partial [Myxococcota bacterium]|nr:hypothetical protein [Myxococcota bacterium]
MTTILAHPPEIEATLALRTIVEAASRERFLAAVREAGRADRPFDVERLQGLMAIEEHFQALLLYDQIELLRQPPPMAPPHHELALAVQRFWLEAANGLQRFLRHRGAWDVDAESQELARRATGLAVNAIHGFVKWGYHLDGAARPVPWRQLHTLFLLAERDGFAPAPLVLHPSQPSFSPSVRTLYLRTLLLDLLNRGSLTRIQVEIADGWLSSWCDQYALETEYLPGEHLLFVDPSGEQGMRLVRGAAPGAAARYLGAARLRAQIDEVQAGLRHGRLFSGHGAGAVFPVEQHVALLAIIDKQRRCILDAGSDPIEERCPLTDREADVAPGLEAVLRKARAPASPDDGGIERWRVHDLSPHGFGFLVDGDAALRVVLNDLLAIRNQQSGEWIVATVVRKLSTAVAGEVLVGAEVLCYRPVALDLGDPKAAQAREALFLPGADGDGRLDAILMRSAHFTPVAG